MKEINQECEHDFVYSHIEYPTGTFDTVPPNKEVVICRRCGLIKKFFYIS
jgi:hypothetical protein